MEESNNVFEIYTGLYHIRTALDYDILLYKNQNKYTIYTDAISFYIFIYLSFPI